MTPQRFTLRKEYFGGIVHDAVTLAVDILDHDEYRVLSEMVLSADGLDPTGPNRTSIERFLKAGYAIETPKHRICAPNMRAVTPPAIIPDGMLTAPIRVFDSFTRRCNFQCDQCYFSSGAFVEDKRRTIAQTKQILRKFYEAGTMEWRFTGGEALMMPDIYEAVAEAKSLGMNVGIYTNGWWSEDTKKRIFTTGIDEIAISLEGSPSVNDARRKKGGYEKVLETLTLIHQFNTEHPEHKINVCIAAAIGTDNVQDVPHLVRTATSFGFNINFIPLKPSGRARYTLTDAMLLPEQYKVFAQTVQQLREDPEIKKSGTKISLKYKDLFCPDYEDKSDKPFPFNYSECGALTTYLSMMPDGTVFSCPFILDVDTEGKYVGPNMIDTSVEDAWNHPNFTRYRKAEKIGCTDCRFYMKQCRGKCRATVLGFGGKIEDGKLIGDDPQCFKDICTDSR